MAERKPKEEAGGGERWASAFGFLKPTNPQEALALVLLCVALIGLGGGTLRAIESLFAEDPWEVRADRVCLDAGNEYLSVDGDSVKRLRKRISITGGALAELEAIGASVPIASALSYNSMLGEKREMLRMMERELSDEGGSIKDIENSLQSEFNYVYAPAAEELGLSVCGQGSGMQ